MIYIAIVLMVLLKELKYHSLSKNMEDGLINVKQYVTDRDVKLIVNKYNAEYNKHVTFQEYTVNNASDKLLGFLSDYWKLKITVEEDGQLKDIHLFLKAISRANESRACLAKEWKVFDKEILYFMFQTSNNLTDGLKPWSAKLIATLQQDILVFEDLEHLQYKTRNKLDMFDAKHMLQVLRTLANFHAASLLFEDKKCKELNSSYKICDEYQQFLHEGGYRMSDLWFRQCMTAALDTIEAHSKYGKDKNTFDIIKEHWSDVWSDALELNNSSEYKSVLCHRDLWNNNIMLRYINGKSEPVDCLLVDFQGTRYQPLVGDVMLVLYCNLDPKFREDNMQLFLEFYYKELSAVLSKNNLGIDTVLPRKHFLKSANEFRKWGLIVNACLFPQNCLDDSMMVKYFSDTNMFQEILNKNKTKFINDLIIENQYDYKNKVLEVFEEIVERYILTII